MLTSAATIDQLQLRHCRSARKRPREAQDLVQEAFVQDEIVTEIVTFDGAVFEHSDLPTTLSTAVATP